MTDKQVGRIISSYSLQTVTGHCRTAEIHVSFFDTVEGCYLWNTNREVFYVMRATFKKLPLRIQHRLTFAPNDSEFIQRVQMWKTALIIAQIPASIRFDALHSICQCYIKIKRKEI